MARRAPKFKLFARRTQLANPPLSEPESLCVGFPTCHSHSGNGQRGSVGRGGWGLEAGAGGRAGGHPAWDGRELVLESLVRISKPSSCNNNTNPAFA